MLPALLLPGASAQDGRAAESRSPITLLVGFPAGGGVDFAGRVLAEKLSAILARPVIVDNRPGAGGQIAARLLKAAPTDGSVLLISNAHTLATVPHTVQKAGYEPTTDFRPVSNFANFETVLVASGAADFKTYADMKKWALAQRDGISIGVPAPASVPEFIVDSIGRNWSVKTQAIPYKGAAPLANDVLAGQVPAGILTTVEALNYGKSGKMVPLAVSHRTAMLPGVPSFEELGLRGLDATDFLAVYAPAATPDAVVAKYAAAIHRVAALPEVAEKLRQAGQEVAVNSPAEQSERLRRMSRSVAELVTASGFKPE